MRGAWLLPAGGVVATAILAPITVYAFSEDETPAWIRSAESLHALADDVSGGDPYHWFGRYFVLVYLAGLGGLLLRRREHRPVRVVMVALGAGALADLGAYWLSDSSLGMVAGIVEFLNLPVLLGTVTFAGWRGRRAGAPVASWAPALLLTVPVALIGLTAFNYWPHGPMLGVLVGVAGLSAGRPVPP